LKKGQDFPLINRCKQTHRGILVFGIEKSDASDGSVTWWPIFGPMIVKLDSTRGRIRKSLGSVTSEDVVFDWSPIGSDRPSGMNRTRP
jgi:hypothetical protein